MDHPSTSAIQSDSEGSATLAHPAPFSSKRIASSFAYCRQLTRSHYENFPVGSLLVPSQTRPYVCAVYAFARIADDLADEGDDQNVSVEARLASLDDWRRQLDGCIAGKAEHLAFPALAVTLQKTQLPIDLLRDLLSAFRQDVVKRRYQSFDEVLDYCRRSANPIGRMILMLFGYCDEERARLSDSICTALQLTNFWQDVSVDIERDRVYLPLDEMQRFGATVEQIRDLRLTPEFGELLRFEVERTRELFKQGMPLLGMVSGRLRYELRLTWLGGMSILEKIERGGFDTLRCRPVIGSRDKLRLLARAFLNWL